MSMLDRPAVVATDNVDIFRATRQLVAGQKYINPDGSNQAWERDTVQDIAEEIGDALTLLDLLREQLGIELHGTVLEWWLNRVGAQLESGFNILARLNKRPSMENQVDLEDLKRSVWLKKSFQRHMDWKV